MHLSLKQIGVSIIAVITGLSIIFYYIIFEIDLYIPSVTTTDVTTHYSTIHPNDRESLIAAGCFTDPVTYKPETPPNSTLPDSASDAWTYIQQTCAATTLLHLKTCPIPNAYHGVFGNNMTFKFHHYVSLKSVHDIVQPFAMYIHGFEFPLNDTLFQSAVK
ncbi:UNVERIFIED_CONTAM: hypothetical protein HDU68_005527, partial [Siphonaria sp. JEL0065]